MFPNGRHLIRPDSAKFRGRGNSCPGYTGSRILGDTPNGISNLTSNGIVVAFVSMTWHQNRIFLEKIARNHYKCSESNLNQGFCNIDIEIHC